MLSREQFTGQRALVRGSWLPNDFIGRQRVLAITRDLAPLPDECSLGVDTQGRSTHAEPTLFLQIGGPSSKLYLCVRLTR